MGRIAVVSLAALLASLGLAGCLGGGSGGHALDPDEEVRFNTGIEGRVLDLELRPVPAAFVRAPLLEAAVRSQEDGTFALRGLPPGEHLVTVSKFGFKPLTYQTIVRNNSITELDFILEDVPTGNPYHDTQHFGGFIQCEIAVGTEPSDTEYTDCSIDAEQLNPGVPEHTFEFGFGALRVMVEAAWTPNTRAANILTLGLADPAYEDTGLAFGEFQGPSGLRTIVVESSLMRHYPEGGSLRAYMRAAPSLDEHYAMTTPVPLAHPPVSAGLAFHQEFDLYFTVFYYGHGAPAFSAIPR